MKVTFTAGPPPPRWVIREPVRCIFVAENPEDVQALTSLWKKLVLGQAHLVPGSDNVDSLMVDLLTRDLAEDSAEMRS